MGLKEFYYSIEDKYYAFIEWLANNGLNLKPLIQSIESKGIPSLPLFTALLLIIVGGAYLYTNPLALQGIGFGSQSSLTIRVQGAAGEAIPDALVSIVGPSINLSSVTSTDGTAYFDGVSAGTRVRITVSKTGFNPVTRDFTAGSTLPPFILRGGVGGQVTLLVVDQDSAPVSQAQVSYVVSGQTRNTVTSRQGVAQLSVAIGTPVTVTVSGQGFSAVTETFTADTEGYQHQITLTSSLGAIDGFGALAGGSRQVPSPNDDDDTNEARSTNLASTATVHVDVLNSTGGLIPGATVVLFNYADQSQLAADETNGSRLSFTEIPAGVQAYVAVDVDGFVSQVSSPRVIQQGTTFTVTMPVVSNTSASNLTVSFSDDGLSTAFTVEFYVLDASTHQILRQMPRVAGRNRVVADLPAGSNVYIAGFSDAHVRFATEPFTLAAGGNNSFALNLTKKTADNSVNVRVNTVDFYNAPVRGYVTPVLQSNNRLLLPGANSSTAGLAELKNMPLQAVLIRGTNGSFYGEATLDTSLENTNVTVKLLPTPGEVRLRAVDIFENNYIEGATFTVSYRQGTQVANLAGCPLSNTVVGSPVEIQNGLCTLTLASGVIYTLTTTSPGFYDKTQTFFLEPNQITNLDVELIPTTSNQLLEEAGFDIVDAEGNSVFSYALENETGLIVLKPGEIYTAVFDVIVKPNTNGTGVYLRLGGEGANDNAVVFKGYPLDDTQSINSGLFTLRGASSYSPASCGQGVGSSQVGVFKWLDAFAPGVPGGSMQIKMPFIVTKSIPNRLNVSYRAYATFPDGSFIRSPADPVLGSSREVATKRECAATTYNTTFKLAASADKVVQCGSEACLMLSFKQGQKPAGGEGYEVWPAITRNNTYPTPLSLDYTIFDFNPNFDDGTELKFETDRNSIAVLQQVDQIPPVNTVSYAVSVSQNRYSAVSKTPAKVTGGIKTHPTLQANPNYPIMLTYGNKVTLSTFVSLLGLPQQAAELAALPAHYILLYNASPGGANAGLTLLFANGTQYTNVTEQGIDFYADPILPADALMLLFNFSNAPCQQLIFNLEDTSGCFEHVVDPRSALSLPEEYGVYGDKLSMLKYDASTDRCQHYSKNPNTVKTPRNAAVLKVVSACTQQGIEIPLNVKVYDQLTSGFTGSDNPEFNDEYHAVTVQERAWEEPAVPLLGVDSSYLHVLYNNRQYSRDNYVRIYAGDSEETATNYVVLDNAVVLPVQGMKPIATREPEIGSTDGQQLNLLGVYTPDSLLKVYSTESAPTSLEVQVPDEDPAVLPAVQFNLPNGTTVIDPIENQADSMEASRHQVLTVLRNTAFRRRQDCNPPRPCPFGMFPYSAFVNIEQKPAVYHLAGDVWTGKFGNGKSDFEFFGLTGETCSVREQEGIYDYYWEYRIRKEDGNAQQDKKYKPLQVEPLDYATFGCSTTKQLCGKLSFNGGQCINNCGDGWYYGAFKGMKSQVCDGKTEFKVKGIYPSTERGEVWGNTLKNTIEGAVQCLITEYAGAWAGCNAGNYFGGPVGGAIGSEVGRFAAGYGASRATDAMFQEWHIGEDTPSLPKFFGGWQKACGYAGIGLKAYSIYEQFNTLTTLTDAQCPGFKRAWQSCFCMNPVPGVAEDGWGSTGCAFSTLAQASLSSPNFQRTNQRLIDDYEDYKERETEVARLGAVQQREQTEHTAAEQNYQREVSENDALVARLPQGSTTDPDGLRSASEVAAAKQQRDAAKAELDAATARATSEQTKLSASQPQVCYSSNVAPGKSCSEFIDGEKADLEKLSDYQDYYSALCTYPFVILGAQRLLGGTIYEVPERVHLAVINGEEKSDSFIEAPGGWITGEDSNAVDCTPSDIFPGDSKDYVWHDWDLSSLRAYEGEVRTCMDYDAVKAYVPTDEEAISINAGTTCNDGNVESVCNDGKSNSATFFITSRG